MDAKIRPEVLTGMLNVIKSFFVYNGNLPEIIVIQKAPTLNNNIYFFDKTVSK